MYRICHCSVIPHFRPLSAPPLLVCLGNSVRNFIVFSVQIKIQKNILWCFFCDYCRSDLQ